MSKAIFLSYSRRDLTTVGELHTRLKEHGYRVWWDQIDLLPGQDWELEIWKAIKSALAVIVCLSSRWVHDAGYVQKELRMALEILQQQPEGDIFLIPLKLDDCDAPPSLSSLHWIRLSDDGGWEKLCRSIDVKLPRQKETAVGPSSLVKGALSDLGAVIRVEFGLSEARRSFFLLKGRPTPPRILTDALIDTGAQVSCVDIDLLTHLGVRPHGFVAIQPVTGHQFVGQFPVSLRLTGKAGAIEDFVDLQVVGVKLTGHKFRAIIGRDVLSHYRMLYNGGSNTFELLE